MKLLHVEGDEVLVHRLGRQFAIGFLKPLAYLTEASRSVVVVDAIVGHLVDEEERQNLDTPAL